MPPCETTGHGCHLQAAQETRGIVTAEEATLAGDLGGAVTKTVIQTIRQDQDQDQDSGAYRSLHRPARRALVLDRFGTFPGGIAEAARALI